MHLVPTQDEVVALLRKTGALRDGFFEYPGGLYSNQYLQVALAMSSFQAQKTLSVGLSRLVRTDPGLAVVVFQPNPHCATFGSLPFFYLAKLDSLYCEDRDSCAIVAPGHPAEKVWQ